MNKLQKEAIAHYDRMIKWAKKQNPNEIVAEIKMRLSIGELFHGDDCVYCKSHFLCGDCALNNKGCCGGLWVKLYNAKTWKTWIKYAKKVKQYIKENG